MQLFAQLAHEFSLRAEPYTYTQSDMEPQAVVNQWHGYTRAFSHVLLRLYALQAACEQPAGLAALAEVKAFVTQEIEDAPELG